jgi:preprotein translocase subunit SecG
MNWLYTATIILHVLLASGIVALVLLQRGRGADAGAGFGSGASGTVFGARGSASFLSRSTATLAGLFIATSLALAYLGSQRPAAPSSVTDQLPAGQTGELPALPSALPGPTSPGATDAAAGAASNATPAPEPTTAETTPSPAATDQAPAAPSEPAPKQ